MANLTRMLALPIGPASIFQKQISNFGWLTRAQWAYVCDWAVTLVPCLAGLLVTMIAKFDFLRRSRTLRWAAYALESELWRYRTRSGQYSDRPDTWTTLMQRESSETSFGAAHRTTQILKAYVMKQRAISHDKELERYHASAACVECMLGARLV